MYLLLFFEPARQKPPLWRHQNRWPGVFPSPSYSYKTKYINRILSHIYILYWFFKNGFIWSKSLQFQWEIPPCLVTVREARVAGFWGSWKIPCLRRAQQAQKARRYMQGMPQAIAAVDLRARVFPGAEQVQTTRASSSLFVDPDKLALPTCLQAPGGRAGGARALVRTLPSAVLCGIERPKNSCFLSC